MCSGGLKFWEINCEEGKYISYTVLLSQYIADLVCPAHLVRVLLGIYYANVSFGIL